LNAISFGDLLGHTIEVTPPDAMAYQVIGLTLQSWFLGGDNRPWGEIFIDLPDTLRSIDQNGNRSGRFSLAGEALRLTPTLAYEFNVDGGDLVGHSCNSP